MKTKLQSPG